MQTKKYTNLNNNNNNDLLILDVHISCEVFYNYSFKIPIDKNDFIVNNNDDIIFKKLCNYIITYVKESIYNDLIRTNNKELLTIFNEISNKFHIHGRTINDILYPNLDNKNHLHDNSRLFVCTHC